MFRIRPNLLLAAWLGLLLCRLPASAQVILKPNGQNAVPLRVKSLAADTTIDRQFAATKLTLTFQNETADRIEADFIYTLPPDTLVTSFAYWYGSEKVVAKIVEKEEAAAIYTHITTRMRDPALVELIGKRTFRARIFPVMPNNDLKVEMTMAQSLPSGPKGAVFTFPLQTGKGNALDTANVVVRVKADDDIAKVIDNIGLPVTRIRDGYLLKLAGTNYRPQQDLRVTLLRASRPLHVALYAAPSGAGDGFFALALTPDRALANPKVRIRGVTTYEVVPGLPNRVKAHQALTLFGRYIGSGPATITLTGRSSAGSWSRSRRVRFGAKRERNNLATKLWAARRMEQLSAGGSRAEVMALSRRYGMPSKYTSWLAVPKAEMERYEQEKIAGQIDVVARRLALEVANNRAGGRNARQLQARLNRLCRRIGSNPKEVMRDEFEGEMYQLANELATRLCTGSAGSPTTRRLRAQLNVMGRLSGMKRREITGIVQQYLESGLQGLAHRLTIEEHRTRPNRMRIAALRGQLRRIERASGVHAKPYLAAADSDWTIAELYRIQTQLQEEYRAKQPDKARIKRLTTRAAVIAHAHNRIADAGKYEKERVERLLVRIKQEKVGFEIASPLPSTQTAQLAALKQQQAELAKREDELRARMGDPLLKIDAPADAQQVIALMPGGEIKRLAYNSATRHWEARFDIPTYAKEGEYVITVIIVFKDGRRKTLIVRYHVDLTPPTGAGRAQIVASSGPMLRLEMEASEDTARVKALLPWGEEVALRPSGKPHHFFALVPLPPDRRGTASVVTYILTDRAHNRTAITVDMEAN